MATNIDSLSIKITASSNSAIKSLNRLTSSLNALKGSTDFSKAISNVEKMTKSLDKLGKSSNGLKKIQTATKSLKGGVLDFFIEKISNFNLGKIFGDSIGNINNFVENSNLFSVAMGEYTDEATKYAEKVQDLMSIDMSQWMRAQGTFMSMGKGFGMATEQAYKLSKGMTEISYDLSSLFNIPIEEAFLKVRSGIAGELEPLRNLGFALSQASLQELAYQKGITKSVQVMTEAEKAQLRYVAIVQQARNMGAVGDFAKTLESPANALRILQQQLLQLSRTLGSVFIPILTAVLPYIQAFVKVVTQAISVLATWVGFKMPKWDNKSWGTSGVQALGGALDDATGKAKKLKGQVMGFDELNVLNKKDQGSGGGPNVGGGGDLGLDLESVWTDEMMSGIENKTNAIVEKIKAPFLTLGEVFKSIWDSTPMQNFLNNVSTTWNSTVSILTAGFNNVSLYFSSMFANMKVAFDTWGTPIFNGISNLFSSIWLDVVDPICQQIATIWKDLTETMLILQNENGEALYSTIFENFNKIIELFQYIWDQIVEPIVKPFLEELSWVWDTYLKEILGEVGNLVNNLIQSVLEIYNKFIQPIVKAITWVLTPAFVAYGTLIGGTITSVVALIGDMVKRVVGIFNGLIDFLMGIFTLNWKRMWEGVSDILRNAVGGLAGIIKYPLNLMIDLLNSFIRGLNSIKIPDWVPLVGGKGINIPRIPKLASGGQVDTGQMFIARERGPEMVGTMGGKTTVANNQQIVEGISQGVYKAVMDAMGQQNFNNDIYIDSIKLTKQVAKTNKKLERQTGRNLMFE